MSNVSSSELLLCREKVAKMTNSQLLHAKNICDNNRQMILKHPKLVSNPQRVNELLDISRKLIVDEIADRNTKKTQGLA